MNRFILSLVILSAMVISGCNPSREVEKVQEKTKVSTVAETSINKEQIENDFVAETEKYLNGILGYIDEMNVVLNDEENVELGMASLNITASELFSSNNKQRESDSEFVLKGDIDSYVKYEVTNENITKIQDMIFTISQDINEASMNYDEALIVKTRGNVSKLKTLTNEAIEQLQLDNVE